MGPSPFNLVVDTGAWMGQGLFGLFEGWDYPKFLLGFNQILTWARQILQRSLTTWKGHPFEGQKKGVSNFGDGFLPPFYILGAPNPF